MPLTLIILIFNKKIAFFLKRFPEKLELYDLLNGSMELVFQKIQKWDI